MQTSGGAIFPIILFHFASTVRFRFSRKRAYNDLSRRRKSYFIERSRAKSDRSQLRQRHDWRFVVRRNRAAFCATANAITRTVAINCISPRRVLRPRDLLGVRQLIASVIVNDDATKNCSLRQMISLPEPILRCSFVHLVRRISLGGRVIFDALNFAKACRSREIRGVTDRNRGRN